MEIVLEGFYVCVAGEVVGDPEAGKLLIFTIDGDPT